MERKLASVQCALEIVPIAGADAIELVRINGWQCVTKKGEFNVGDLGIFLEIDAIPPDTSTFQFLWTAKDGDVPPHPDKFRIRTMKLRGALSQGLFLPLDGFGMGAVAAGDDVTEKLGVTKYEPPIPAGSGGEIGGLLFPGFVPKTDEIRVQSAPEVLTEIFATPYAITLKYDGTSATYCVDPRDGATGSLWRVVAITRFSKATVFAGASRANTICPRSWRRIPQWRFRAKSAGRAFRRIAWN